MGVRLFTIEATGSARRELRRFRFREDGEPYSRCPTTGGAHNAIQDIGTFDLAESEDGSIAVIEPDAYAEDPRWPTHCRSCGYEFRDEDEWQVNQHELYEGAPDGQLYTLREVPPGAVWIATWMGRNWQVNGGRGPAYVIKLPNGSEFLPGAQASNCDRKGEDHDCWCVHGQAPDLTIDKNPEPGRSTCSSGAGSIWSGQGGPNEWHGFVRGGELVGV